MHTLTEKLKKEAESAYPGYPWESVDQEIRAWLEEAKHRIHKIETKNYRPEMVDEALCLYQQKWCEHIDGDHTYKLLRDDKHAWGLMWKETIKFCPICGKERP